jgi:predicted phosphodiesterase
MPGRMRYLIISDVHANEAALSAVLGSAQRAGWDEAIFLGDAIGYGDQPEAAVAQLSTLDLRAAVQGNHEAMLLPEGPRALPQTRKHASALSAQSLAFLAGLQPQYLSDTWGAVHGALRSPWEYLLSIPAARANQPLMRRSLYFVGHTHVPALFVFEPTRERWRTMTFRSEALSVTLEPGTQAFFNPGSVGLPRDGLDAASYAVFQEAERRLEVFRVPL